MLSLAWRFTLFKLNLKLDIHYIVTLGFLYICCLRNAKQAMSVDTTGVLFINELDSSTTYELNILGNALYGHQLRGLIFLGIKRLEEPFSGSSKSYRNRYINAYFHESTL